MKRMISFFLAVSLLLCLSGCDGEHTENTANFYYVRNVYTYGQEDGVMAAETFDITNMADIREIMDAYLNGPQNIALASPFPLGTEILDFLFEGDTLYVTLSGHIVTLSNVKQALACSCFARTVMELTGAQAVRFQTDSAAVARMDPILIERDSFLLYDDYRFETTDEIQ